MRKIAALGDSLTAGWAVRYGRGWVEQLAALYPEEQFYNAGLPGDTTDGMRERADQILREIRPDILLFMGGTNDLLLGRDVDGILENIRSVHQQCRECGYPVRMFLLLPLDVSPEPGAFAWFAKEEAPRLLESLQCLRQKIVAYAEEQGLRYISLQQAISEGSPEDFFLKDGVHINETAHREIAQFLFFSEIL